MTIRRGVVWLAVAVLAALAAYVRLAPVDPDRWHVDLGGLAESLAKVPAGEIRVGRNNAAVRLSGGIELLTALDRVALAAPRTRRIAGDPKMGHVTWQTRSLLWGFPDYVTAQSVGDELILFARSRFGGRDWGLNSARLSEWLSRL